MLWNHMYTNIAGMGTKQPSKKSDEEMCCFPSPPQHQQEAGILGKIISFFVVIKVSSLCDILKLVSASSIEKYMVHPEQNNFFAVDTAG